MATVAIETPQAGDAKLNHQQETYSFYFLFTLLLLLLNITRAARFLAKLSGAGLRSYDQALGTAEMIANMVLGSPQKVAPAPYPIFSSDSLP